MAGGVKLRVHRANPPLESGEIEVERDRIDRHRQED